MSKPRTERVIPDLARHAVYATNDRGKVWTEYIVSHFRSTGNLAPGCDLKDMMAWLEANEPERLAAITGIRKGKR